MSKAFKKLFISTEDIDNSDALLRIINQLQANIENSISPLIKNTRNDSNLLTNVKLQSGDVNVINHKLNRNLSGWTIVDVDTFTRIRSTGSNALTLNLYTEVDCIVSIEVF